MAAWWQARRWVALLELIDQLPPTSRTEAAKANDPEAARAWLEREREQGDGDVEEWSPPLTDWNTATAIGAEQRDLLQDVVKLLAAIRHGLPVVQVERLRPAPKTGGKPFPRPVTAIDRARASAARDAAYQVVAWFFPHASHN